MIVPIRTRKPDRPVPIRGVHTRKARARGEIVLTRADKDKEPSLAGVFVVVSSWRSRERTRTTNNETEFYRHSIQRRTFGEPQQTKNYLSLS